MFFINIWSHKMMSMADVEGKLRKCSHAHSQDSMGQLIHPSTDFKMSVWSSAFILCILIGWVTGKGSLECQVVLFDTYSPNYRELDKSRYDENYYSRRNRELDNSRRDENSNSRRNRELSNSLLRRDLLFSHSSRITGFSPRIQQFSSRFRQFSLWRELSNSMLRRE